VGWQAHAAEATSADEKSIAKLEHDWNESTRDRDRTFFERNLTSDFTFINESGQYSSGPAAYIDALMSLPEIVEMSSTEVTIRIHGTTAVATGRFSYKDASGKTASTRYTDTYAKDPDGWKAVGSQETTTQ